MDPDENLNEQNRIAREIIKTWDSRAEMDEFDRETLYEIAHSAARLSELVIAFRDWQSKRTPDVVVVEDCDGEDDRESSIEKIAAESGLTVEAVNHCMECLGILGREYAVEKLEEIGVVCYEEDSDNCLFEAVVGSVGSKDIDFDFSLDFAKALGHNAYMTWLAMDEVWSQS